MQYWVSVITKQPHRTNDYSCCSCVLVLFDSGMRTMSNITIPCIVQFQYCCAYAPLTLFLFGSLRVFFFIVGQRRKYDDGWFKELKTMSSFHAQHENVPPHQNCFGINDDFNIRIKRQTNTEATKMWALEYLLSLWLIVVFSFREGTKPAHKQNHKAQTITNMFDF